MGLISRLYRFKSGGNVRSSEVNAEFSKILNLGKGNIMEEMKRSNEEKKTGTKETIFTYVLDGGELDMNHFDGDEKTIIDIVRLRSERSRLWMVKYVDDGKLIRERYFYNGKEIL